jgi:hypothetical protein
MPVAVFTVTLFCVVVSMTNPVPVDQPARACPPERTVNGTAFVRAKASAAETSAADAHRATTDGRMESNRGLKPRDTVE